MNLNENKKSESYKKRGKEIFSSFFSFFKKEKKIKTDNDLDKRLIYSLSPKKIPNIKQIKHIKKVLSYKEKLILNISFVLIFIILIFFSVNFYKKNLKIYPNFGGEYTEGLIGSPKNINPLYDSARDVDSDISRLVFSSLFKKGPKAEIINDLVDSYNVSENGLEYEIKIKENVKWHHGEFLTSDDVIFTFETIKNPEYGSPLRPIFSTVNINKIDNLSFKFILIEPYSAFLELLTFSILPQNLWINISPQNAFLHELNIKPIGSGPYKFKSLTKNKSGDIKDFVLVPNNDYYDQVPYIAKITLKFYNNYNELVAALNNNQVDGISYLPYGLRSDLISQNSLNFNKLNLPQITSIFLSKKNNSILEKKELRQILASLIDKNRICDEIFSGNASVSNGPVLPSSSSFNEELESPKYSFEDSIKYLDEAAWNLLQINENEFSLVNEIISLEGKRKEMEKSVSSESDSLEAELPESYSSLSSELETKLLELKNIENWEVKKNILEKFSSISKEDLLGSWRFKKSSDKSRAYDYLTINLTTVDLIDNMSVASFIKSSWDKAGIKTFIKTISPNQVQSEIIKDRNFEALLLSQVVGGDQDNYAFWHSSQITENGLNISEYKNKEVDKLLEDARISLNPEEKIEKYKKFQEVLNNDFPVIFLYYPTYTYIQNKKIKGFDFQNILNPADRFNNISNWYIKVNRKLEL